MRSLRLFPALILSLLLYLSSDLAAQDRLADRRASPHADHDQVDVGAAGQLKDGLGVIDFLMEDDGLAVDALRVGSPLQCVQLLLKLADLLT
jgi:hypothetical protein